MTRTIEWKDWNIEMPDPGRDFLVRCKDRDGVDYTFSEAVCYELNEWTVRTVNSNFEFPESSEFYYWIYITELW